jgi:hypothetical protein
MGVDLLICPPAARLPARQGEAGFYRMTEITTKQTDKQINK